MTATLLLLAALAVLPSDRLQMADRLFNRGNYAAALAEYQSLSGNPEIGADELVFRIAECNRAVGKSADAMNGYAELVRRFPDSQYAAQARFLCAMGAESKDRVKLLAALDSDRVDKATRAAALYHLGIETKSAEALEKCVSVDPKGKYSEFAMLRLANLLISSPVTAERRKGIATMLELAFSKSELAEEALYLAAIQSYRDRKYGEAGSLFRRYRKLHAKGPHFDESQTMSVWCDFLQGRYADAAAACGEGKTDDLAYIRAACAFQAGDNEGALKLFRKYLEDYPQGRYRKDAELPIARIEFDQARKAADGGKTIESAKRSYDVSKLAADELRLAWAYENAGKLEEARDEYGYVAKNFPDTAEAAEALYRKALIYVRAESWSAAEMCLAEALATGKLDKFRAEALYWRGVSAMRLEHEAEGSGFLKEALGIGLPLDTQREARLVLADADLRGGRTNEARVAYAKLVREGACVRMSTERLLAVGRMLEPADAEICAKALTKSSAAEWRQAGYTLLGQTEERREAFTAAADAYGKALLEPVKTTEAATAALRLGILQARAGEYANADKTLKTAVALNADDTRARAEAYSALAENAEKAGDFKTACAYATVVTALFDDETVCARAKKILADHPECAE